MQGHSRPVMHQFLAAAAPHDAVTNQALALQDELRIRGIASEIIAEHVDVSLEARVARLNPQRVPRGPILLRYSIWSKAAQAALEHASRLAVIYHNITPPDLVGRASPPIAALCARARRELPRVIAKSELLIADSAFNAEELNEMGAHDVRVIPLLLDIQWSPVPEAAASHDVLFVGRIAPNKRIEDLIDTVVLLRRHFVGDARLRVAGSPAAFPGYREALAKRVRQLDAGHTVLFLGEVSDAIRDEEFSRAGAYLSMSEHEGFCVPILEAMGHGLPVVARDAGAVRETASGAALIVPSRSPLLAAAALERVLTDAPVRAGLSGNAHRRLGQLDRSRTADALAAAIAGILP
jgi:glycosyltransferase involved in cell wall biosynthesis